MGKTFSQPTYFYKAGTKPDLVDTNGPIYSRTGVKNKNIYPTNVIAYSRQLGTNGKLTGNSTTLRVTDYDLSVISLPYSIMPNESDSPINLVRLAGYIETSGSNYMPTTNSSLVMVSFLFNFSDLTLESSFVTANVAAYSYNSSIPQLTGTAFPKYSKSTSATVVPLYAPMAFNAALNNDDVSDYNSYKFILS